MSLRNFEKFKSVGHLIVEEEKGKSRLKRRVTTFQPQIVCLLSSNSLCPFPLSPLESVCVYVSYFFPYSCHIYNLLEFKLQFIMKYYTLCDFLVLNCVDKNKNSSGYMH